MEAATLDAQTESLLKQRSSEALVESIKRAIEQNPPLSLAQFADRIDSVYLVYHPRALGVCKALYRQMLALCLTPTDDMYQKLLECQVKNGSVASVFNMVRFAMQYYPSLPFWTTEHSMYYDLVTNAYIDGRRMSPTVLAKAFVRLSQNSDIELRLSNCIGHFRHRGIELHLDSYNAALFQLFRSASDTTFEFFLAMKEWGQTNVTSYKLLISHLCNEGRVSEAQCRVQEACQAFDHPVDLLADVFKSYLANRQVAAAMDLYKDLLARWPFNVRCAEIERVILIFLTYSEVPLARTRTFLRLVLDKRGLPWHVHNYVFLISLYLGHDLGQALRVLHSLAAKERGPWLSELHSSVIKTYLCAKPHVVGEILCNTYIEKFKIGHADPPEATQHCLVSLFATLDARLATLLHYAEQQGIRLTPATHYRMVQKLSTLTRYDKICEYYNFVKPSVELVLHKKSIGIFAFALMCEHEWSNLLHLVSVCASMRVPLPDPYKPVRELPSIVEKHPFLLRFPSNAAPISHILAYSLYLNELSKDHCKALIAVLSAMPLVSVRDLRLQFDARPEAFEAIDSALFMALQKVLRFPRELKPIYEKVIQSLPHADAKE